ncbi:ABC-2 family transporter protein [Sedimentibacter sp. zth1]|uniref:ABC transporter permease n=1 Tax=Sedimentibacter sp. zth1 TaxID=2816908 RepID=UPI001A90F8C9|nr:ABC-2 family transporter protein [Sedimentibacter sp. zth1]QSX04701.1 ABC-2 family transporter protein [Sedimentibacter sp. zth1]
MKKYLTFFKMRFKYSLQYRAAAYAGVATQFFWGIMQMLIFSAFYKENPDNFPMKFHELTSYIWLQQSTIALFFVYLMDNTIFSDIKSGNVAYELCRPMNLYNMWFAKNAAIRLAKVILRCIPILIFAMILPKPYGLTIISNASTLIMFFISMLFAFLLVLSYCMLIYIATFFMISAQGIRMLAISITEFLSGAIIPIPFFPEKVQHVISLSPWGCMQNIPFRIYSGNIAGMEAINSIVLQFIWIVILTAFGKMLLSIALKKVVVQGG